MKLKSVHSTRVGFFTSLGCLIFLLIASLISGDVFYGSAIVTVNCVGLGRYARPKCPYCEKRFPMWGRNITVCPHCGKHFKEEETDEF